MCVCAEFTSPLPCVTLVLRNENGNYLQSRGAILQQLRRQELSWPAW